MTPTRNGHTASSGGGGGGGGGGSGSGSGNGSGSDSDINHAVYNSRPNRRTCAFDHKSVTNDGDCADAAGGSGVENGDGSQPVMCAECSGHAIPGSKLCAAVVCATKHPEHHCAIHYRGLIPPHATKPATAGGMTPMATAAVRALPTHTIDSSVCSSDVM